MKFVDSFQNLALLENLYRLKALGYSYTDPLTPNIVQNFSETLPDSIETLSATIAQCYLCDLSKSRRQSLSGFGHSNASIMFIDAYVSTAEDEENSFYVGRSGTMLRDMIEKVLNLTTKDVYITHAVKCKPFGFQSPSLSEYQSCAGYLTKQIALIQPKIIVPLGPDAYEALTKEAKDFDKLRGEIIPYNRAVIIPMYHPLHLIRNPSLKKEALRDLQTIKGELYKWGK